MTYRIEIFVEGKYEWRHIRTSEIECDGVEDAIKHGKLITADDERFMVLSDIEGTSGRTIHYDSTSDIPWREQ